MRMARKPSAVARELLRNFPKGKKRRRRKRDEGEAGVEEEVSAVVTAEGDDVAEAAEAEESDRAEAAEAE
jgi:hypothetical protein